MTALLELIGVSKRFGGIRANDQVSLRVEPGAIVGLIGPNGSGKTTLFNAIAGTHPIDCGSIRFKGEDISMRLAGEIARQGIVRTFQQPRIYREMSVGANMLVSAAIRRSSFVGLFGHAPQDAEARSAELLEFVGLAAKQDTLAGDLSFGQQKLLELAMALVNNPELLLLDEPTAGINPVLIGSLIDRLKAANRERGITLLVIEHNMPVIMGIAEHIYCLAHGRLLAEGSPQQIKRDAKVLDAYLGGMMARPKAKREEKLGRGGVAPAELDKLAGAAALLAIDDLHAGYGQMEVLRGVSLRVARGRALCLVGPNGAGKSTVLNAIYGFARVFSGTITVSGRDIAKLPPSEKLRATRLAYVLQRDSVFPDMTVEENLLMGGYLLERPSQAQEAAERVLDRYPALKARRVERARVLSGGERRLLEISRALIMDPEIVLIDEPSIGLEPRAIDMIFEVLRDLRDAGGKTLMLVEQNARKGLDFADAGYVLVAGQLVKAGPGRELVADPEMGRLFLGGD